MATVSDAALKKIVAEVEAELAAFYKSEMQGLKKASPGQDAPVELQDTNKEKPGEMAPAEMAPATDLPSASSDSSDSSSSDSSSSSSDSSSSDSSSSSSDSSSSDSSSSDSSDSSSSDSSSDSSFSPSSDSSSDSSSSSSDSSDSSAGELSPSVDVETLKHEYCKLSPDELKAHLAAAKAAMLETMGSVEQEPTMKAEASAESKEETSSTDDKMEKSGGSPSESSTSNPNFKKAAKTAKMDPEAVAPTKLDNGDNKQEALAPTKLDSGDNKPEAVAPTKLAQKSEVDSGEYEALKKRVEENEKTIELLTKALDITVGQPIRKAVTSMDFVARTEEPGKALNKSEIDKKIRELDFSKLNKSERELVTGFYNGDADLNKLGQLFTKGDRK